MKRTLLPLLLCFAASTLPLAAQSSSVLSDAQRAYLAGDLAGAKLKFEQVLAADPQNVAARNYLKAIAVAEKQAPPGAKMEQRLALLTLPKVEFKDATLDSVLDALRKLAAKASEDKITINFVVQPGVNVSTPITLSLHNVPFTEVLKYLGGLANAEFAVGQYAITVKPKSAAVPASASTSAPQ